MDSIEIKEARKTIIADRAMLNNSRFNDVAMIDTRISDANLINLEITNAQLGGAYIHNIGMPPQSHPLYNPEAKQKPLRFENCDLNNSTITNCNLNGINITDCNLTDMKINGILVEDMLKTYNQR